MAGTSKPPVHHPAAHPPHPLVPRPNPGSKTVRRDAVMAAKVAPGPAAGHPAVWQPWQAVITTAEDRMRAEIGQALRELESGMTAAGHILDVAESMAAESASQLQAAAWKAWQTNMDAAALASDKIMTPALAAYQAAATRAYDAYTAAMTAATSVYQQELAAANSAKGTAAAMGQAG